MGTLYSHEQPQPPTGIHTCVDCENQYDYTCECLPGFGGDGVSNCEPTDECNRAHEASCPEHARCKYGEVEMSYVCKSVEGRTICLPFAQQERSCYEDTKICHANAQCVLNQRPCVESKRLYDRVFRTTLDETG